MDSRAAYGLTWRKLAVAVGLALLMCWPMWVFDAWFIFADTESYLRGGGIIWQTLWDLLPSSDAQQVLGQPGPSDASAGAGAALAVDADGQSTVGRSFTYSAGVFAVQAVFGLGAIPVAQALYVALFIVALFDAPTPWPVWLGVSGVAVLTTLPWFAVFLIPDLFAAIPLLFGALLVGPLRHAKAWQTWLYAGLTALAVSFHYGFPPVMAGVAVVAGTWLLWTKALSWRAALALVASVCFAPVLNLAASSAVLDTASTSPQRLPIPLARSLSDGPARWYLEEVCPEAPLALCEAFGDDIPQNISSFLWAETGVQSLPPALLTRIRDEEVQVLVAAFKAYPLAQSASLLRNGARQLILVGTKGIQPAALDSEFRPAIHPEHHSIERFLSDLGPVLAWITWIAAAPALLLLVAGRLTQTETGMVLVVLAGLIANAAIFGGLSAPVERYHSRLIWVLPLLSIWLVPLYVARRRSV